MNFLIRNFRGCIAADITVSRVALLAGDGGASKTSILQAVRGVVTGTEIPVKDTKKKDVKDLLHDGAKKASVDWEGENFNAAIKWQSSKIGSESEGKLPFVSAFAAGMEDFCQLDVKSRSLILAPLIGANPTLEDLTKFLKGANVKSHEKIAERLWGSIDQDGWDAAHKQAEKKRAELKGQWKQASGGETYGAEKAEDWEPDGWSRDLDKATLETLSQAVETAEKAHEAAIAANAVANIDRDDLVAKAGQADSISMALTTAQKEMDALCEQHRAWTLRVRPAVPEECPHCHGAVNVNGDRSLSKAEGDVDPATARKAAEAFDNEGVAIKEKMNKLGDEIKGMRERMGEATRAKNKLAELTEVTDAAGSIEDAHAALRTAQERLALFKAKTECDKLHSQIEMNQTFVDALAPTGVRYEVLKKALETLNDGVLADLSANSGWPKVRVTEEMDVQYDGRSFSLLCRSEQSRAMYVMQIALAKLDGSDLVVLDDTDDLPVESRGGLLQMLVKSGLNALIAMMIDSPSKVPDLAAKGVGATYWVAGGEATLVSDLKQAA